MAPICAFRQQQHKKGKRKMVMLHIDIKDTFSEYENESELLHLATMRCRSYIENVAAPQLIADYGKKKRWKASFNDSQYFATHWVDSGHNLIPYKTMGNIYLLNALRKVQWNHPRSFYLMKELSDTFCSCGNVWYTYLGEYGNYEMFQAMDDAFKKQMRLDMISVASPLVQHEF